MHPLLPIERLRRCGAWLCVVLLLSACEPAPPVDRAAPPSAAVAPAVAQPTRAAPPAVNPSPSERTSRVFGARIGFRSRQAFEDHYDKHGQEFGTITAQQYLARAQALRDTVVGGDILEAIREDRVSTRFDRGAGDFLAFNSDGTIRTFFRPNDGERYFRRQARRRPNP